MGALCFATTLWAQNVKSVGEQDKKPVAKGLPVYTYLGTSNLKSGLVSKETFDSLLKQGIRATDSTGTVYKINSFNFNYAERNLYEDSVGNLMIIPDYMLEHCFGDTITKDIAASIYQRTKAGDTAYFDQVIVTRPNGTAAQSTSMKFVITK